MRILPRSLRARIVWSTTLITAVAMIAMAGTVVLVVIGLTESRIKSALGDRLDAVESTLVLNKDGSISQLETSADAIEDSAWVFDLSGKEVVGPKAGKHVAAAVRSLSRSTKRTSLHRGEHLYLAAPARADNSGKTFAVIVVAESYEPYEANQKAVVLGMLALAVAVTAGTAVLASWIVGRTLEPVNAMARSAGEWSEHDLETRFDPGSSDNEIATLGETLNLLLDRVATTIRGEQLLTSELAHELRTPITAIRGEAELGLMMSTDPAIAERLGRIVALVDRMSATISTLMAVARGHSVTGQRSNVAFAVSEVLDNMAVPPSVRVDVEVDDSSEAATPADMIERALSPLVDNALRFASNVVTVRTSVADRVVSIHVSDDGPGVDTAEDIFTAGFRTEASDGAGLGLALAQRVARSLGGDVRMTSAADPTTFTLDVPAY